MKLIKFIIMLGIGIGIYVLSIYVYPLLFALYIIYALVLFGMFVDEFKKDEEEH